MTRDGPLKSPAAADLSTPRPVIARIFAFTTLLLPVIFDLLSMSFALKTIYDPAYAASVVYDDTPAPALVPNTSSPYTQKASPFFSCTPYPAGQPLSDIVATNQTCTREQLWGSRGLALCLAADGGSLHVCQQRTNAAGLYVAGTALVGLALVAAAIALGFGAQPALAASEPLPSAYAYARLAPPSEPGAGQPSARGPGACEPGSGAPSDAEKGMLAHRVDPVAEAAPVPAATTATLVRNVALALAMLLATLAALCLFVAHYLAFNALVEDQAPSGDVGLSNPLQGNFPTQSPWYLETTGVVYASLAWLMVGVGVLVAALGVGFGGLL